MLHQKRTYPKLTSKWYSNAGEAAWHAACSFLAATGTDHTDTEGH